MHTLKNEVYIILIMYNQSNAITCLKCKVKFIYDLLLNRFGLPGETKY
jgi:hypothetical protein